MILTDKRPIVVGIGEALLDCYDDGKNRKELGGAPLIFAYHAAKTHCRSVIISAIGNDDRGNYIKEQVIQKGVTPILNIIDEKPTGLVDVKGYDTNNPQYYIHKDAAWTEIQVSDDEIEEWAQMTAAVYFGSLAGSLGETSKDTIHKYLEKVPKGCWKIFDVNLRYDPGTEEPLNNKDLIFNYIKEECNVLKVDEGEIEYVGKLFEITETNCERKKPDSDILGNSLMDNCSNIKILILTKGEKGSTVFWRDEKDEKMILSQSIHISVDLKNTVGAGDAMVGAFIGELLDGNTVLQAHLLAAQRADMVCKDEQRRSMPDILGKDFFFSYSKEDSVVVDFFYHKFTNNGRTVFKDKPDIIPGKKFGNVIAEAIDNCRSVVYFSSKTANKSPNVLFEITTAITKEKEIIIIRLDESRYHKKVRTDLEPIQYERFNLYKNLHDNSYDMFYELDKVYNRIMGKRLK